MGEFPIRTIPDSGKSQLASLQPESKMQPTAGHCKPAAWRQCRSRQHWISWGHLPRALSYRIAVPRLTYRYSPSPRASFAAAFHISRHLSVFLPFQDMPMPMNSLSDTSATGLCSSQRAYRNLWHAEPGIRSPLKSQQRMARLPCSLYIHMI